MSRKHLTLLVALLAPSLVAAQAATTTWKLRVNLPADARAQMPGNPEVLDARMTMTTDGDRLAVQIDPGPESIAAFTEMDISSARLQLVMHHGRDSVTAALIMPPEATAAMGGGLGIRIDAEIPDSGVMQGMNIDSLVEANQELDQTNAVNTGRTSTVAGITCEEWLISMPQMADSTNAPSEMKMCVAEEDPAIRSINEVWYRLMSRLGANEETLRAGARKWFGNREMVAVRFTMGDADQFVFELESNEMGTNPGYFVIPDGLTPFPLDLISGMVQAQMQQQDSTEQ
ncbi:MAG TPA: hypothetical protein PLL69_11860 [Gemmatimonadales bacterium]|nr:hypothetical protein [Gemmatimonadales bacterium]